jgi:xanthine dehydrogenase YagT iron-sulfur-binding subunit
MLPISEHTHALENKMSQFDGRISRRNLIRGSTVIAAGGAPIMEITVTNAGESPATRFQVLATVHAKINGVEHLLELPPRVTLLDMLRERLQLTGAKKGCNRGECGACTVLMDGRRVNSCLVLAVSANGKEITTVEGLAMGDHLHPVQQAFIDHDAFQCGFCTSGQIISGVACIAEGHTGSNAEIREWMSGNICRCSAYPQIAAAIEAAAQESD